jgi:hypothetical protein
MDLSAHGATVAAPHRNALLTLWSAVPTGVGYPRHDLGHVSGRDGRA